MANCIGCGFLAVRDEHNDGVYEATESLRNEGSCKREARLFCYKASEQFRPIIEQQYKRDRYLGTVGLIPWQERSAALHVENQCGEYRKWIPGKTPKEHEEMAWQDITIQLQRDVLELQRKVEQNTESRHWRLILFGVLTALLSATLVLLGQQAISYFWG